MKTSSHDYSGLKNYALRTKYGRKLTQMLTEISEQQNVQEIWHFIEEPSNNGAHVTQLKRKASRRDCFDETTITTINTILQRMSTLNIVTIRTKCEIIKAIWTKSIHKPKIHRS